MTKVYIPTGTKIIEREGTIYDGWFIKKSKYKGLPPEVLEMGKQAFENPLDAKAVVIQSMEKTVFHTEVSLSNAKHALKWARENFVEIEKADGSEDAIMKAYIEYTERGPEKDQAFYIIRHHNLGQRYEVAARRVEDALYHFGWELSSDETVEMTKEQFKKFLEYMDVEGR